MCIIIGISIGVRGEIRARYFERYREEKKIENDQIIKQFRLKLKNKELTTKERKVIEEKLNNRIEFGPRLSTYSLPSNHRGSGYFGGLLCILMGIACLFYRSNKNKS